MDINAETLEVNGIDYVRADSINNKVKAEPVDGMDYCLVRTYSAGVFAGYIDINKVVGKWGTVLQARRIWQWSGAASLSQLSVDGTSKPEDCRFPCEVEKIILTEIIEVLPCTVKAKLSIDEVKIWSK